MRQVSDPLKLVIAGLLIGSLAACSQQPAENHPPSPTIATVGDAPISQALFDAFVKKRTGVSVTPADAALKNALLTELKQLKAASLAGEQGMDAELKQQLELQRLELLAQHAATLAGVHKTPTDDELKLAYRRFVNSLPEREYHAAHILVATEGTAGVLITRLQAGENFSELAAAQSVDDSKIRGGDLGWIAPGNLPAAFTDAVESLEPGGFTTKPVHTSYGWHVIQLLETRDAAAPLFEHVRAQLAADVLRERYARFLEGSLTIAQAPR